MTAAAVRQRAWLQRLFGAGLAAVDGTRCVRHYLESHPVTGRIAVAAFGKAAGAMLDGAFAALQDGVEQALLVPPAGYPAGVHTGDDRVTCVHGDHPVPGQQSLQAGARLLQFIDALPDGQPLLCLVSGGTSSVVEVLRDGIALDDLQRANRWLLGSGLDIAQVNHVRRALSRIKGGGLAAYLGRRPTSVLLLSDVPGDDPAVIGSGPLHSPPPAAIDAGVLPDWLRALMAGAATDTGAVRPVVHHVVAGNGHAVQAIRQQAARETDGPVGAGGRLAGDAQDAVTDIVGDLNVAPAGVYIWGGETTVRLPEHPGNGGRNQQLALAVAQAIEGDERTVLLAAGTDGRDGNSDAAGAIVDGGTVARGRSAGLDPADCLQRADAGSFLRASGDRLVTGPTGTNVMDIVIALKQA